MSAFAAFLGSIMSVCYSIFKNYGIAIIIFTLITKVILFPLSVWLHKNSIKMVKMQPEINNIKVRYYGDKDRIADEQSNLYKKEKYNAFASLIPLAIQIALLLGVVNVIYHPITYILRAPAEVTDRFVEVALENNPELDLFKESLLIATPANFADYPKTEQIYQAMIDQIDRAALMQLHELIVSPLPDDCADVEDIFYRPDPNNVKDMLERFIRDCLTFTGNVSDAIPVSELTQLLQEYVKKFGGDSSKVTPNGVGKYLNDLGIKKNEISGKKFAVYRKP